MAERTTEPERFWAAGQFLVLHCCDRAVPVDYLPSQPRADIVAASAWGHDRLCEGFRTPAVTNISTRTTAGVRKPPRDETAGRGRYWAVPHSQLWGFWPWAG